MKKIFATFAIILFILSAVPVFAEDDTLGIKTQEKLRIAEGENTNLGINTKIEADEKLRIASDTKVRIDTRKTELRRCQLSDTEECKTIREDAREDAKTYLENLAEAIKARLEKLKEKVEDSERLTTEEKAEIKIEIEAQISEVEDIKAQIETADTREEILSLAKQLREILQNIKNKIKFHEELLLHKRVGEIINQAEKLEEKLNKVLERLTNEGLDTATVQASIDEFNIKIELAKTKYNEGVSLFEEAKEKRDSDKTAAQDLVKQAHEKFREAHQALKEAASILRKIVVEFKQLKADALVNVTAETED